MLSRYMDKEIRFTTNQPINVHIAVMTHLPNPLPETFDNLQDQFQIVIVKDGTQIKKDKVTQQVWLLVIHMIIISYINIKLNLKTTNFRSLYIYILS